jgi:hypothetical protein
MTRRKVKGIVCEWATVSPRVTICMRIRFPTKVLTMKLWRSTRKSDNSHPIDLLHAIAHGIAALEDSQFPDGSWPLLKAVDGSETSPASGLFSTAGVLLAVGRQLNPVAVQRAVDYLLSCRETSGQWCFDSTLGVPCDADDTACALACLALFRPEAVTENDVEILQRYWRAPEGPFQSWDPNAAEEFWADEQTDDAVVNCNVLIALKALGASPDARLRAAVVALVAQRPTSRYYNGPAPVLFAAHRADLGLPKGSPLARLTPKPEWDALQRAYWLSTQEVRHPGQVAALLRDQKTTGLWPYCDWCTGTFAVPTSWGSESVTTAFVLDALHRQARMGGPVT